MSANYAFQELMEARMKKENWSQRAVADMVTAKVGRKIHASAINRLLKPTPTIPAADVLDALAEIFETDPSSFIRSVYSSRYGTEELTRLGDFVRKEFEQASEADQRRILDILRARK